MRPWLYGTAAVAAAAAVTLALVAKRAELVRPDVARAVVVLVATPDRDVRSKHERPVVVARAGQGTPGQPTSADPNVDRQGPTRARLAAGDGAWSMGPTSATAPAPSTPPTNTAPTLAPLTPAPTSTGMGTAFTRPPAWLPSGTNGATLGGTPVAPPFAMSFGPR